MEVAPIDFLRVGLEYMGRKNISATCVADVRETDQRRFKANYGVSPLVCAQVWMLICHCLPAYCKIDHLLWALLFMKIYSTESVLVGIAQVDKKTFWGHVWTVIFAILDLKSAVVSD